MATQFLFNTSARPVRLLLLLYSIFLFFLPGIFSLGVVTLKSIQIFKTHEWLNFKPTIYFHCKGENKTILPDVKETDLLYSFRGEESWQPLTEFADTKCKRCGFYEKDTFKPDDVFDEWEFCPSDFMAPDGKYARFKDKEFNATFSCPHCMPSGTGSNHTSGYDDGVTKERRMNVVLVIIISVLVASITILAAVAAYKYWQKRKREHDQARFLKLFEDGDDIEDELGLGHII